MHDAEYLRKLGRQQRNWNVHRHREQLQKFWNCLRSSSARFARCSNLTERQHHIPKQRCLHIDSSEAQAETQLPACKCTSWENPLQSGWKSGRKQESKNGINIDHDALQKRSDSLGICVQLFKLKHCRNYLNLDAAWLQLDLLLEDSSV